MQVNRRGYNLQDIYHIFNLIQTCNSKVKTEILNIIYEFFNFHWYNRTTEKTLGK